MLKRLTDWGRVVGDYTLGSAIVVLHMAMAERRTRASGSRGAHQGPARSTMIAVP